MAAAPAAPASTPGAAPALPRLELRIERLKASYRFTYAFHAREVRFERDAGGNEPFGRRPDDGQGCARQRPLAAGAALATGATTAHSAGGAAAREVPVQDRRCGCPRACAPALTRHPAAEPPSAARVDVRRPALQRRDSTAVGQVVDGLERELAAHLSSVAPSVPARRRIYLKAADPASSDRSRDASESATGSCCPAARCPWRMAGRRLRRCRPARRRHARRRAR